MSKDLHTCVTQKVVYASRVDAIADRLQINRFGRGNVRLYPYECHLCGQWHLSSESRQANLRKRRHETDRQERKGK